MIVLRLMLPFLCLAALSAADPAPVQPPFVGVGVEEVGDFDAPRSLRVTRVVSGASFDRLGVKEGDLLISVNGTKVTSANEFRSAVQGLSDGAALAVVVTRNGVETPLAGTLSAPRPRELADEGDRLRQEAVDLRTIATQATTRSSLEDALRLIKQVEMELPKAAEEFKRVYPNGTFRVSIQIDINSDKDAKVAEPLKPSPPTGPPPVKYQP